MALRLAKGDWHTQGRPVAVVLAGRRRAPLDEVAREVQQAASARGEVVSTLVHPADLTSPSEVGALFEAIKSTYGRVDVLFNNAGTNVPPTDVDSMSYAAWRQVVAVNLDAAFLVAQQSFTLMKEQAPQGGRIINNGSISADRPRPVRRQPRPLSRCLTQPNARVHGSTKFSLRVPPCAAGLCRVHRVEARNHGAHQVYRP